MGEKLGINKKKLSMNSVFDEFSKSKPLASLQRFLGLVYDGFAYDENPHFHCLEPIDTTLLGT